MDFIAWPKTKRHEKELQITVTEKIDGTNGQLYIDSGGILWVGSRSRWITPGNDNYGFASWAYQNESLIKELGPGRHYGEWYGQGIQRRYGLDHRRFALFNTDRWIYGESPPPLGIDVVPVVYHGPYLGLDHLHSLWKVMSEQGSLAVPGWMNPEGLCVYFHDFGTSKKMPFNK